MPAMHGRNKDDSVNAVAVQQGLVKQREMDAQRTKMIIKLKEDRIVRLQARPHAHVPTSPCSGQSICCA